jgi:hypothetical protein
MIFHLLGRTLSDGIILDQIRGNRLAAERFESFREHLGRNGVDLTKTEATLGPWLTVDVARERFVDNDQANRLLRRDDRKPFVVPEVG